MSDLRERGEKTRSVVLVHGSQHGSWCWRDVIKGLEERGIRAIAVDLPGRGANSDRAVTSEQKIAVIEEAIEKAGGNVVLCGHSAAGDPISRVAVQNGKVCDLVYLAAILPTTDPLMPAVLTELMELSLPHLDIVDGSVRMKNFESAHALMYHDCSMEATRDAWDRLIPEPSELPSMSGQAATAITPWDHVRTTYIVTTDDRSVPAHLQHKLAERAHRIIEIPTSHSPFISQPDLIVDLLAGIAAGN